MIITIDGPVAAGKTSAAVELSSRLAIPILDTGAIYRCVALEARRMSVNWEDEPGVTQVAMETEIGFQADRDRSRVFLGGHDVTSAIRHPEISQGASIVSALPGVRTALLALQRRQATAEGLIAEGRDTGSVVFPEAERKFFLTASTGVRAHRRFLELRDKGVATSPDAVLVELQRRDHRDTHRAVAPLVAAADAMTIDSSQLSLDQVVDEMHRRITLPGQESED